MLPRAELPLFHARHGMQSGHLSSHRSLVKPRGEALID